MVKRRREQEEPVPNKRWRATKPDHLSRLSDELLLKILSFLSISQLAVCQRLSHKYQKLSGDRQIWKSHYYNRFVRPRASRLPGLRDVGAANDSLRFASKASIWLDEDHLIRGAGRTDWKRQYKLRHNWSRGSCAVNEIPVAERESTPPVLVQMSDGIVYTADKDDGIRAWSTKGQRSLVAQMPISTARVQPPPTCMAVETSDSTEACQKIVVGLEDGSFAMYALSRGDGKLKRQFINEPSTNGVITAVAVRWPYVVTMTAMQLLSVYLFEGEESSAIASYSPRLLHSLKSHSAWPPLSISLRTTPTTLFVSIAYALPTYLSGWTVGIQEIKLAPHGELIDSRVTSAIDQHYRPLAFSSIPMMHHLSPSGNGPEASPVLEMRHIHAKPTTLSYTHPYLLVSHPDNTLTLYLITSTADTLAISPGSRLWGHTSAVSGAHVGGRGKAVSISRRGDELRVWELEGGFASSAARKRLATGDLSVKIKSRPLAGGDQPQSGLDLIHASTADDLGEDAAGASSDELTLTRGWIGFDEENVVVLKERQDRGKQTLVVYDFT